MKKLFIMVISLSMILKVSLYADEGMWLPILINQNMATMTEMGMQLTAEDIYNINESSVKDAIIALDRGSCTAEVVSPEGLILTNHHCGYGEIQAHSNTNHDYLTDGFWAMTKEEELANPGKTASFLISVEDVTVRILGSIPEGTDQATRNHLVDSVARVISAEASEGTHYEARVEGMFRGNYYYVFVYEVFRDVRLVGAPPESIGKFGSDTDNWMWPRHTGDFSMFRIYTDADGKPADYDETNIPLKPKHYLPICIDGVEKDDFAFIMGYPGRTQRFMTSYQLKYTMEYENPNRAKIRGIKQAIWKEDMDKDSKVRIQYASKHARSANYWKYSIEQNKALKKLDVIGQKQKLEEDFRTWVNKDEARKAKYGNALALIEEAVKATSEFNSASQYIMETQLYGAESYLFAYRAMGLYNTLQTPDSTELIARSVEGFRNRAADFFKDYNAPTDKKSTKAMLKLFIEDVDAKYYPEYINTLVLGKYKGNVDKFVDVLFKKSIFVDNVKLDAFLAKPTLKVLAKDPAFIAATAVIGKIRGFYGETGPADLKMQEGMRLFVEGLLEMNPETPMAPDANSTMRLTYGTVGDYNPADAVHYNYFTTIEGIMEKEDPSVREFTVPAKLIEIWKNKDYGQYANEDGTMHVCFTTNNDITGGNSGSPVINGKGQLIGIAFDGNSEAMSGDIAFEKQMQKCINVDIRYVLLIIDKFAGAGHLVEEMTLVSNKNNEEPPLDPVTSDAENALTE